MIFPVLLIVGFFSIISTMIMSAFLGFIPRQYMYWIMFAVTAMILPVSANIWTSSGITNIFPLLLFALWGAVYRRAPDQYFRRSRKYVLPILGIFAALSAFNNLWTVIVFAGLFYMAYTHDDRMEKLGLCLIRLPESNEEMRYARRIYFQESLVPFAAFATWVLSMMGAMNLLNLAVNLSILIVIEAALRGHMYVSEDTITDILARMGIKCQVEEAVRGAVKADDIQQHLDNQ